MRVDQQAGFLLVSRPYSESSLLAEFFSREHGRFTVIAKGARRLKSPFRGVLIPLQPLLISWMGKGEVPTLTAAELDDQRLDLSKGQLSGEARLCGFYCSELILKLVQRYDPHPSLYDCFAATIDQLLSSTGSAINAKIMRRFEFDLLRETGYGLDFKLEMDSKTPIEAEGRYDYLPSNGFRRASKSSSRSFSGQTLLALSTIAGGGQSEQELLATQRVEAKQVMRQILSDHLAQRPIVSRDCFFPGRRDF